MGESTSAVSSREYFICGLSVYPERSEGSPVHQRRPGLVAGSWRTASLCYRRSFAASRLRINLGKRREHVAVSSRVYFMFLSWDVGLLGRPAARPDMVVMTLPNGLTS